MADKTRSGPRLGIGDDAAVLPRLQGRQELLITTDLLVEGSHFERQRHPAAALGHKVLARGLSDIAAMGGVPSYALLSLCLPGWAHQEWQKHFLAGLFRLAERHSVTLVGGDLAAGERFVADIVVLGRARRGRTLERGKAQVGDIVYVSGQLGGSALGLERLRSARSRTHDKAVARHLYPVPRLALG
ncbi:MAG: thiamine-monophosphate kinase, partial [Acidobacteria bacterium]|nr:thiamine-monophosphate kinase [Acidobacteriota bacterium]